MLDQAVDHSAFASCSIESYFARDRYLEGYVARLHQSGITTIGELLALPADKLFRKVPTTEANKQRLRDALSRASLSLS